MGLDLQYFQLAVHVKTAQGKVTYALHSTCYLTWSILLSYFGVSDQGHFCTTEWICTLQLSSSNHIQLYCGTTCNVCIHRNII